MGRRKKSATRTPQTPFEAPSVDKTDWGVEAIVAKRWAKGVLEYEVKWTDHDEKQNTWEPLCNLVGAEQSVADFERAWEQNYNAPQTKRARVLAPLEEAQDESAVSLQSTIDGVEALSQSCTSQPCLPGL
jgi:hypothetical protein